MTPLNALLVKETALATAREAAARRRLENCIVSRRWIQVTEGGEYVEEDGWMECGLMLWNGCWRIKRK